MTTPADQPQNEIVTSFLIIDMARDLGMPLSHWQEALIIRHGEARYAQQERQTAHRVGYREERRP